MTSAILIVVTSVVVCGLFLGAVYKSFTGRNPKRALAFAAAGLLVWIVALGAVAGAPAFRRPDIVPPPFAVVFLAIVGVGIGIGLSPLGRRIASRVPVRYLVLFHSFRFFAEAALFSAYLDGICPVQMTLAGNNKDVVTAASAVLIAAVPALYRSRSVLVAFNVLGLFNLLVIAVTAALSMPSPFRYYRNEPSQAWVAELPYIYLPGLLVAAAFAGHFILIRAAQSLKGTVPAVAESART